MARTSQAASIAAIQASARRRPLVDHADQHRPGHDGRDRAAGHHAADVHGVGGHGCGPVGGVEHQRDHHPEHGRDAGQLLGDLRRGDGGQLPDRRRAQQPGDRGVHHDRSGPDHRVGRLMAHTSLAGSKASGAAAGPIVQFRAAGGARDVRVFEVGVFAATAVAGEVGIGRPAAIAVTPATPIGPDRCRATATTTCRVPVRAGRHDVGHGSDRTGDPVAALPDPGHHRRGHRVDVARGHRRARWWRAGHLAVQRAGRHVRLALFDRRVTGAAARRQNVRHLPAGVPGSPRPVRGRHADHHPARGAVGSCFRVGHG
jgi:hypothetical protein